VARPEGAERVLSVDKVAARLAIAERIGADALVDAAVEPDLDTALRAACGGEADVLLEMSERPPRLIHAALNTARPGA
jgi:threonine dehydrogenase-like Zn-dependent dehydrogenase